MTRRGRAAACVLTLLALSACGTATAPGPLNSAERAELDGYLDTLVERGAFADLSRAELHLAALNMCREVWEAEVGDEAALAAYWRLQLRLSEATPSQVEELINLALAYQRASGGDCTR